MRIDLTGKIFGDLKVLKYVKTKNTHAIWECECMRCGKHKQVSGINLRSGNTKSCGSCGKKVLTQEQENQVFRDYKMGGVFLKLPKLSMYQEM